ncbi:MAG: hypothetical protein KTR25_06690 [Myxococcales bacterium]|nr:hypothetical protein [Myxococcales bacterium]
MSWLRPVLLISLGMLSLGLGEGINYADPPSSKAASTLVQAAKPSRIDKLRTNGAVPNIAVATSTLVANPVISTRPESEFSSPVPGFAPVVPTLAPALGGLSTGSTTAFGSVQKASMSSARLDLETGVENANPEAADHPVVVERLHHALDSLATRIDLVSDKVSLLRDTALGGGIGKTRVTIRHKNELGNDFLLEKIRYLLDGGPLFQEFDQQGRFSSVRSRVVFDGQLDPGAHELKVEVNCRSGGFGVFSYMKAYRYKVSSKYVFRVREGRTNRLDIVVFQKSDITLSANERLSVRYDFTSAESSQP